MRRSVNNIKKGSLIKTKYSFEVLYGITTSRVEYHIRNKGAYVWEYVWVLWDNGEHNLYKVDMLEVISESR